jgi:beta-N-acetylhexosaminidase
LVRRGGLASAGVPALVDAAVARAAGRPLVVVVRDAHRYPVARAVVMSVLTAQPEAVIVEMGLPLWQPPGGLHVATYGAAHTNAQAAAEILGLTGR